MKKIRYIFFFMGILLLSSCNHSVSLVDTESILAEDNDMNEQKGIVISDKLPVSGSRLYFEIEEIEDFRLENNYVIENSVWFEGKCLYESKIQLPEFTDELDEWEAQPIKDYFEAYYITEKEDIGKQNQIQIDELTQWGAMEDRYLGFTYLNYDLSYRKTYLIVQYRFAWYGGGAHGLNNIWSDIFNLETGELLTNNQILREDSDVVAFINEYVNHMHEDTQLFPIDYENLNDFNLTLSDEGLVVIFREYEIGCFADGIIQITIPYSELQEYLLLITGI